MSVEEIIKDYLLSGKTRMMQVATCNNEQPWVCTVLYAIDDDMNLIWLSLPTRRHSKEIAKNAKVAAAIAYDQQPPLPYVRGIQAEGEALLLEGAEAEKAIRIYGEQLKSDPKWIEKILNGKDPIRAYKIKVRRYALFDTKNFSGERSQEWVL